MTEILFKDIPNHLPLSYIKAIKIQKILMLRTIIKLLFLSFLISACWEKQSHEITAPEPAHYRLNGILKDIDLDESLDSVKVKITTAILLETSIYFSKTTFSDAEGKFAFDTLYVGAYQMRFYRDGYEVLNKRYFQNYHDSTITFHLPDVYYIPGSKLYASYSEFKDHIDAKFSFHPEEPYLISLEDSIYRHTWGSVEQQWIQIQIYSKITGTKTKDASICFGKIPNYFYLLARTKEILYKIRLSSTYLQKEKEYSLLYNANDIYYAEGKIYISSFDKIYVHDEISFSFEKELTPSRPDIYITSFCIHLPYIWLSDNEADLLYLCDHELKILKTYVPYTGSHIYNITEMSYDYMAKDWYSGIHE